MSKTVRSIGAVIAGFVAASVVMMAIEMLNGYVLHPELRKLAEGATDRETMKAVLAATPVSAFLVVVFGWALGSLVGGFLAARIGRDAPVGLALILGGLLTLAGIANNVMLPPPTWFWIPTLLVFLPAAYVGAYMATKGERASRA